MNKFILILAILVIASLSIYLVNQKSSVNRVAPNADIINNEEDFLFFSKQHPLTIESLRKGQYPGSDLVIEETLPPGSNFSKYIASYLSEGNKIYGLLTIPTGEKPVGGWPAIIFNHGYIPPREYQTTAKYVSYVDGFARSGFVVFKPDYRGYGKSQGESTGAYGSNAYTVDVLNALSSLKKYPGVNPEKIGMWGHSLGGFLTLRSMVVSKDVKVGVIWAGVVGSYPDLLNNWRRRGSSPPPGIPSGARRWRDVLVEQYGTPEVNPTFWNSISANSYLSDISGPLQLHHGTSDTSVPDEFSQKLQEQMKASGRQVELLIYPGDDHNLASNFTLAMQRSIDFFEKYLKN